MIQMITACQLCAKITVENALREEAERIAKMQVAKAFAEEIISPILENLTEVPNRMLWATDCLVPTKWVCISLLPNGRKVLQTTVILSGKEI
jgi:hypothetical protein